MDRRIQQTTGEGGAISTGANSDIRTADFYYSKDWQVVSGFINGSPTTGAHPCRSR